MLQLIDSLRFMAGSLSNLVINLSEGNYRIKCKFGHDEKCETCAIEYKYLQFFIKYTNVKDGLKEYKCFFCCNKNCQHKFNQKLKEQLFNTYKFSDPNNNKCN